MGSGENKGPEAKYESGWDDCVHVEWMGRGELNRLGQSELSQVEFIGPWEMNTVYPDNL